MGSPQIASEDSTLIFRGVRGTELSAPNMSIAEKNDVPVLLQANLS